MTTTLPPTLPPVHRQVTVRWDQAAAFRRFTDGNRAWAYMAVCIVLAWPVYALINASLSWGATGLMVALIASQTLNFHHFIVDSVIWRARRKPAAT